MPHLNFVSTEPPSTALPEQRELVAVGRRGQRAAQVMHVDRVAADVVGRGVQRQIRRASQVLEQRRSGCPRRPCGCPACARACRWDSPSGSTTFRVRFPTCGRKSSTPFRSRAPRWSYCNGAVEREGSCRPPKWPARVRSSHWLTALTQPPPVTSLSLMCRVSGRTSRSPTLHPETACRQRQRGVARARLGREAQERRRPHAAVHRHFPEDDDPGAELIRVRTRCRRAANRR